MSKHPIEDREELIEGIEGYTGSLKSVPYSEISTRDLQVLYYTIRSLDDELTERRLMMKLHGLKLEE